MELVNLILSGRCKSKAADLELRIAHELRDLHNHSTGVSLYSVESAHCTEIRCSGVLPGFELTHDSDRVIKKISKAVANFIVNDYELPMLELIIRKHYGYSEHEAVAKIVDYCGQLLDGTEDTENNGNAKKRRVQKIALKVLEYLDEFTLLNVEGFVRFRLKQYMDDLHDIAEYAIDEYVMEKQYQEFIALLKYFVYIQEAKIPVCHLIHKGGHEFVLLNESMVPIDTEKFDHFTVELLDKEINFEDMIVSALISVSPQKIYIHTREPQMQVIRTIMHIFEDRAFLCICCKSCKPLLGGQNQNQLYP